MDLLEEFLFKGDILEWTTSCEIAKIIAQPCWQVHMLMAAHLEDEEHMYHIGRDKTNEGRTPKSIQRKYPKSRHALVADLIQNPM